MKPFVTTFHKAISIWLITDSFMVDMKDGTWGKALDRKPDGRQRTVWDER